jgi:transitional endoplasmic reticulum ATPase
MAPKKKKAASPVKSPLVKPASAQNTPFGCMAVKLSKEALARPALGQVQIVVNRNINIPTGDSAVLLAAAHEAGRPTQVTGMCIGTVMQATASSTAKTSKSLLTASIQVSPLSIITLIQGDNASTNSLVASTPEAAEVPMSPPPSTPTTAQVSTPSTPFSFKSLANSSLASNKKSPTPIQSPAAYNQSTFYLLAMDSTLARTILSKHICNSTRSVRLALVDSARSIVQSVASRLVYSYCQGQHVQVNQVLTISYQGRSLEVKVTFAQETNDETCIQDGMRDLSISNGQESNIRQEEETDYELTDLLQDCKITTKLYKITASTLIEWELSNSTADSNDADTTDSRPQARHVAGLRPVLDQVYSFLQSTTRTGSAAFMQRPKGVLLHGPSGVGKTSLALEVAQEYKTRHPETIVEYIHASTLQSTVIGHAEKTLSRIFRTDTAKLLILDDVHLICPRRGSPGSTPLTDSLASTLLALLDGLTVSEVDTGRKSLTVIAITANPSQIDPALRRPGRLDTEIQVPLPDDVVTRAEILEFQIERQGGVLDVDCDANMKDELEKLAQVAQGFNGADIMLAVKEAVRNTVLKSDTTINPPDNRIRLHTDDLKKAIRSTRPSAIQSVTVEIPKVYWSSIGGMESVKRDLKEALELPLTHPQLFESLQIPPPRGILLYGPPGCSKTLMARALATEGQMNFLAVKGPELLSKWLGESERTLASLFRRARMASPAIVFFDEIDAIASKRGNGDSPSSSRLLSQLLTELDGVVHTGKNNQKNRVVVIGATNRPDILDSALMRPGRIDRMIYVGVPDLDSRRDIFAITLRDKRVGDDVDLERLASDAVSGGFSGAEIVAICRDAALYALEETDDMTGNTCIYMRHLLSAVQCMQRQITPAMLDFYAKFHGKSVNVY